MCEPTLIMMGISTAAGLVAQQNAASNQKRGNAAQYANSLRAQAENANQVGLAQAQESAAAGQKINDNNLAVREAQASVVARGGPSGLSLDALLGSIGAKGGAYNASVTDNLDRVNASLENQLTNVNRNAASEVNSLKPVTRPDYLGAALKIGSAAYSAGAFDSKPGAHAGLVAGRPRGGS